MYLNFVRMLVGRSSSVQMAFGKTLGVVELGLVAGVVVALSI